MDMEGLSMICAGLGMAEEDEDGNRIGYLKSEHCLDNMKDMLRFLRRDDPQTREVFKQVCRWNIVSKDLIPIIQHYQDDRNLVLNAVKVLVFLTMPIEPPSSDIPQQIEYLWGLKSSITCSDTVAVIVSLLESPLENLERDAFTEDDWKLVQLVLALFRNILAVQDITLQQKAGGTASQFLSLRDKFLELLFHEHVMDLILVITQHIGGSCHYLSQDSLLLLETFHYIFMGQEPELVAKAHLKGSKVDVGTETYFDSLKSIIEEEKEKRKLSRLQNVGCHSQFSGTFTRLTMDGSKAVFKGAPTSASRDTLFKPHKVHRGPIKKIVWDHGRLPTTKENILELLHDFLNQFLSGGYNDLMQSIREDIEKEHHSIQKSDIVVFFRVAQFVTSFQYHKFLTSKPNMEIDASEVCDDKYADGTSFKGDICGPIAASMNESMFLLVISRWRNAFDGLKETHDYKFLSAAGSLMKNMICMLDFVLKSSSEDSREPQTARILLYKLFYDQTDEGMTQFLLNLIKSFDTHKQPKSDLADLVEMIHVIVGLMENLQGCGTLRVSKKLRKRRKNKESTEKKEVEHEPSGDCAAIQNENGIFDGEQLADMGVSHKEGLTEASSDRKGDASVPLQVNEPEISVLEMESHAGNLPQMDNRKSDTTTDDRCNSTSDSSGDEQPPTTNEVDFKVSTVISAFANNSIIQNLCWLLKFYKSNTTSTNHYIICMLRRITDDLELSPMLYQLSLFTTFYDILVEQKSSPCKEHTNIVNFLTSLVRKMLRKMKNQPLLFVEVLFWKTRRECQYINAEYLLHELGNLKKESGNWGNVSGDGESGPSQANGWMHRSIADALGEDEADVVIDELGYQKNKEHFDEVQEGIKFIANSETDGKENSGYGRNSMEHEPEGVSNRKRRLVLSDELEIKIKDLYDKFQNDPNCSQLIAEALDPDGKVSAAQVSNKLKQLGLKILRKKRMRNAEGPSSAGPHQSGEEGKEMERESDVHNAKDLEGSTQRRPLHTRKRVHAFSEDQEAMIKDLFEKFKDHKRCNYMIANALDANGTFTATQVSRKLKQLGLHVSRQKRIQANLNLRDEDLNDFSMDNAQNSDDETLLSLRNRGKKKNRLLSEKLQEQNFQGKLLEDDSDDQILSSILKRKHKNDNKLISGDLPEQNFGRKMSEDNSDDEILSTALQRKNKNDNRLFSEELPEQNFERKMSEDDSDDEILSTVLKDGHHQSSGKKATGTGEADASRHVSLNNNSEAEVTGSINENASLFTPFQSVDGFPQQQVVDDLEDSGDDVVAPGASSESFVIRRKLKMVIDLEDDE